MSTIIIISYDGTPNDDDALALGRALARTGATLELAYVRHSREFDARREELAQHDAERRLEQGANRLEDSQIAQHVVVSASTGEGLAQLAEREGAHLIVFGSDYRTPPGHVQPGTSAQYLLDGGPVAIAVAAAGLRATQDHEIASITVPIAGPHNDVARQTAASLAEKLGATVANSPAERVDLIIVGSAPGAPAGRIVVGGEVRTELDNARASVLVLPADRPIAF